MGNLGSILARKRSAIHAHGQRTPSAGCRRSRRDRAKPYEVHHESTFPFWAGRSHRLKAASATNLRRWHAAERLTPRLARSYIRRNSSSFGRWIKGDHPSFTKRTSDARQSGLRPHIYGARNADRRSRIGHRQGRHARAWRADAPLYVAADKGYFAHEGISVEFVPFASAAFMIAPLGRDEIDVGAGGLSAGLFNAVERGIHIKAVADKVTLPPGSHYLDFVVRQDLIDLGRFKSEKDMKGLRIAEAGLETSTSYALAMTAKAGGLSYGDFAHPSLGFADHLVSLRNRSIDGSVTAEPTLTKIVEDGLGKIVIPLAKAVPNLQIAVLLYSEKFAGNTDLAQRFMDAYLEGARYYIGAVRHGRLAGPNASEVIAILTKYTHLKYPQLYRHISASEIDPDGRMNLDDMRDMLRFFQSSGFVKNDVGVNALVDTSLLMPRSRSLARTSPRSHVRDAYSHQRRRREAPYHGALHGGAGIRLQRTGPR